MTAIHSPRFFRAARAIARERRGSALILVLVLVFALAGLAVSAIYMASSAAILSKSFDRERDFKYVAEAALNQGKSRLNNDPTLLPPDTGFITMALNQALTGADGKPVQGIAYNLYAGRSGLTSGQYGNFASIVAEARDGSGSRFVRRLELLQESFAKYAYWSDKEVGISFGGGDVLYGPVWSNDNINILLTGATFNDNVGTAGVITNSKYGKFIKGYQETQKRITLPSTASLSKLPAFAAGANFSFTAPNKLTEASVEQRIEFVAFDMSSPKLDGDSTDASEGYFRVYVANKGEAKWLRGDMDPSYNEAITHNCGDWHVMIRNAGKDTVPEFFPASVHNTAWFETLIKNNGVTAVKATAERKANLATIMDTLNPAKVYLAAVAAKVPKPRCFLGGDPHLVAIERIGAAAQRGGTDTTFTANGTRGRWLPWPTKADTGVTARRTATNHNDQQYLFPFYRLQNLGSKGVIYVDGTVGISGTLRGRVTLYSSGTVVVLDDLRYSLDPAAGKCLDILGIISQMNVVVADNALNTPERPTGATAWISYDDNRFLDLHAVIMALGVKFTAENFNLTTRPATGNFCAKSNSGRGCLNLTGGLIQDTRGGVGQASGSGGLYGYVKRYSYDRCGATNPPPYFPTTNRFTDNRFYEIDPVRFDVKTLFSTIAQP